MLMRNALATLICATIAAAQSTLAQQRTPIVNLPPASAKTTETLGAILGMREVAGGKVLVNDAGRRQMKLFDVTLATAILVTDSTAGAPNSYGPYATPLIPYVGDSSLFPDFGSRTLLVLGQDGRVVHALAAPNEPGAMRSLMVGAAGVDKSGRLLYKNSPATRRSVAGIDGSESSISQPSDSGLILRADLNTRHIDTLAGMLQPSEGRLSVAANASGKSVMMLTINPLQTTDEWAVLSDGTVALVRGQDYHVDWIHPDGTKSSTGKLPFDWKRLTDGEKQALLDSAGIAEAARAASKPATPSVAATDNGRGGGRIRVPGDEGPQPDLRRVAQVAFVPLKEIADYYPPIRRGAAMPDLDGNLWILPTTSAQSQNGELVYDVVNPKDGLFERVRMPAGRSVAGFAKGGVVYLMAGDRTNGFYLERTRLPGGAAKVPPN
jgi:hypothetical protein